MLDKCGSQSEQLFWTELCCCVLLSLNTECSFLSFAFSELNLLNSLILSFMASSFQQELYWYSDKYHCDTATDKSQFCLRIIATSPPIIQTGWTLLQSLFHQTPVGNYKHGKMVCTLVLLYHSLELHLYRPLQRKSATV